ncbi:hypothetical protein ABK803_07245 [Enterobacter ludwigii]|uniref:hypothetical protein n=1 Tax=Enterobacter ludwigii TaxID=299767 RepID=UPI003750C8DA
MLINLLYDIPYHLLGTYNQMEKVIKYRLSNLQTFIISFFLIIIGCSITRYTSLETAWLFLLGGLFLAFISLLESKRLSRVEKGVSLIFFGVLMGLGIPELFQKNYKDLITPNFKENLSIFTQIAYYVCAGAGGGVLANHAENIKTVDVTPNIHNGSVDTALNHIKALQVEAISQRKKIEQLRLVIIVAVGLGLANLIVTILK